MNREREKLQKKVFPSWSITWIKNWIIKKLLSLLHCLFLCVNQTLCTSSDFLTRFCLVVCLHKNLMVSLCLWIIDGVLVAPNFSDQKKKKKFIDLYHRVRKYWSDFFFWRDWTIWSWWTDFFFFFFGNKFCARGFHGPNGQRQTSWWLGWGWTWKYITHTKERKNSGFL